MTRAGHRTVLAGRTDAERQSARQGISLRDAGITARTRQRYWNALRALLPFIEAAGVQEDVRRMGGDEMGCRCPAGHRR